MFCSCIAFVSVYRVSFRCSINFVSGQLVLRICVVLCFHSCFICICVQQCTVFCSLCFFMCVYEMISLILHVCFRVSLFTPHFRQVLKDTLDMPCLVRSPPLLAELGPLWGMWVSW